MRDQIPWHSMQPHERNATVARAFGNATIWPRYSEDLSAIIKALRDQKIGFDLSSSRDSKELCIAQVGPPTEIHTAVLGNPAEALCVAFLRFMGANVQTVSDHP